MIIKKINRYLIKLFFLNFIKITLGFATIFFIINLMESFERLKEAKVAISIIFLLSFLKIPQLLSSVILSVILISATFTHYQISIRSEGVIIRNTGFSVWKLSLPIHVFAIFLGIFWITFFNIFEIWTIKKSTKIEEKYITSDYQESIALNSGIWIRQKNLQNNGENILIIARNVYKNSTNFANVSLWFYDKNNVFYQRLDAKKMMLSPNKWMIYDGIINNEEKINEKFELMQIMTDLQEDFVKKKIVNNLDLVSLHSIFELPEIIKNMEQSGLKSTKYKVYLHSQINQIFLFGIMTLLAIFFGTSHFRSLRANLKLFVGIVFGFAIFLSSSIFFKLGSSGVLSIFEATWLITLIYYCLAVILIYQKDKFSS